MAILLPECLPAVELLRGEGGEVGTYAAPVPGAPGASLRGRSASGCLRVALVNLMPDKITTETQFARLLGSGPRPVHLTLILPDGYWPKTTSTDHLKAHYRRWSEVADSDFDGLIVTGAPVEHLPFEEVAYWPSLQRILDRSRREGLPSLFICWAAQAALYRLHGVPKRRLARKAFGVFSQAVVQRGSPLVRGLGDRFSVPVSRHSEVCAHDLPADGRIEVLARSRESGLCLLEDPRAAAWFMFNHLEYDTESLALEYARDLGRGERIDRPAGYFPDNDPSQAPINGWREAARSFFRNWIDEVSHRRRPKPDGNAPTSGRLPIARRWPMPRRRIDPLSGRPAPASHRGEIAAD